MQDRVLQSLCARASEKNHVVALLVPCDMHNEVLYVTVVVWRQFLVRAQNTQSNMTGLLYVGRVLLLRARCMNRLLTRAVLLDGVLARLRQV